MNNNLEHAIQLSGAGSMSQIFILGFLLMGLGKVLKSLKFIPNDTIPALLSLTGSIAAGIIAGWTVENVMAGAGAALGAVGGHQAIIKTRDVVTGKTAANAAESKPTEES